MGRKKSVKLLMILLLFVSVFGISCKGEKKKKKVKSEAEKSFERGNAYFKIHKIDSAIKAYETAIQFDSNIKMAHYNLALAYVEKKRYADAISAYEEYLKHSNEEEDAKKREEVKKEIERLKKK